MIKLNVVFWLLIILAVIFMWFVLAFLFKPLGRFFGRLYKDAMDEMTEKENKEEQEKEKENEK